MYIEASDIDFAMMRGRRWKQSRLFCHPRARLLDDHVIFTFDLHKITSVERTGGAPRTFVVFGCVGK